MKKLILAFSHFDTGGLQTLMIRMGQWCKLNNVIPYIIYETCDEYMNSLCEENQFIYLHSFNFKKINNFIKKNINIDDDVTLITFELHEFIFFEKIRSKFIKKYNIKHFIYNVSVSGMIYGKKFNGISGKFIYKFYRKIALKIFNNNQVCFMDEETLNATLNYYNIQCIEKEKYIYLLPMFISNYNNDILFDYKEKNFLTVSRAVFPYKGYLVGLIKDFNDIITNNINITLTIVAFGENYDDIINLYNTLDSKVKENIKIINGLPIEEIRKLLKNTFFYIGMGTTVLDAADESVPSIVVWHSTMENICSGFFSDNPKVVGKFGDGINGKDLIQSTINLSFEQYVQMKKKAYTEYRNNYDINKIIPEILNRNVLDDKIQINKIQFFLHKLIFYIRNFRRKILNIK